MRIQHNIMAMNAYRNYNTNTSALSKNLEKLSSGYKINRAGDDAAGLAISEKMRAQITGLNAAQKNVKDGISLVKTTEGAMQEIQDMLNRMDYLATQSANGTYQDEVDRENLQKEVDQLLEEIDRIADSSNFNGIKLLDGSLDAKATPTTTVEMGAMTKLTGDKLLAGTGDTIGTDTILYKGGADAVKTKLEIDASQIKWTGATANDTLEISIGEVTITLTATSANTAADGTVDIAKALATAIPSGTTANLSADADAVDFNVSYADGKITIEMAEDPDASTPDDDLDPSLKVELNASAGTASAQWNDGSLNMVRGQKPVDGTGANTTISATNLGIGTGAASDGKTIEIDGKTFIIAKEGGDFAANSKDGKLGDATVVTVKDTDTAEMVMEKLANAINGAGTVWSAGTNANGELTLAQTDLSNADKNEAFKTRDGIAGTIKTGTATLKTSTLSDKQQNAKSLQLQIGDTSDSFNQLQVSVGDMHREALGLKGLDISTAQAASASIQKIKDAINYVSGVRGDLGATQNRLEHTANNLSVMAENIQDAESTIRDTDVAEEMMAYTKNNILVQSAQAMLAQANAVPQGVLQLLG